MDPQELPDALNAAGRAYYDALLDLGLDPEGLLWVYDIKDERFRLWLVWSGLDMYGPLAISKLLFRAYRAAALPREVDPFSVYVVSPAHRIGDMAKQMAGVDEKHLHGKEHKVSIQLAFPDDGAEPTHRTMFSWVYHLQRRRNNVKKTNKDWRRFNENVRSLAA